MATNLESMENPENSGNLKIVKISGKLREIWIFVEKLGKLRENEKYVT